MADLDEGGVQTISQEQYDAVVAQLEGLKANRDAALTEAKQAKLKLKGFEGIDPEEHKTLKQRVADIEMQDKAGKAGVTGAELEKLRADARKALEDEYTPIRATADRLAAENRALKLDNVVKTEMAKAGVKGDKVDKLFRLNAEAFDLTDDGKPILRENPTGEIGKYIREDLLKEYPEWFEGSGSSGGGASKSVSGGGGSRVVPAGDNAAFLANLPDIASGKTVVRS